MPDAPKIADPWDKVGHIPPEDPTGGATGSWDVCLVDNIFGTAVRPARLYGWQLQQMLTEATPRRGKTRSQAWMPVRVRQREDGSLGKTLEDVESVSMMIFDSDTGVDLELLEFFGDADNYRLLRFGHTSYSSTIKHPKARIIFPLVEPVEARRWPLVWGAATRWAKSCGIINDPQTCNANRVWFAPTYDPDRKSDYHSWFGFGTKAPPGARTKDRCALLDPAWLIRMFPPPKPEKPKPPTLYARAPAERGSVGDRAAKLAHSWLNTRLSKLSSMAPGAGQSTYTYSCGRAVGSAFHSRLIPETDSWEQRFVQAAMSVGLPEKRARGSFANGLNKGQNEVWQEVFDAARR